MTQQCGKCKWWDKDNTSIVMGSTFDTLQADCKANVPSSLFIKFKRSMKYHDGKYCPVYEERKECKELNPWLPIDENTPKNRKILLYFPQVYGWDIAEWDHKLNCWKGYGFYKPTHYQELPDDPV